MVFVVVGNNLRSVSAAWREKGEEVLEALRGQQRKLVMAGERSMLVLTHWPKAKIESIYSHFNQKSNMSLSSCNNVIFKWNYTVDLSILLFACNWSFKF